MTTPDNLESHVSIVQIRETAEHLRDIAQNALACLGVQEGHADAVTALQASITQLERQRDDAVKQLTKEQDALAAIRAAQETAKATLASLQDQITEAHALIAQGQAFQKDLADFRKKAAAMAPS